MKTTNKVLAIVLSVMLIMSVLPFAAFAGNTLTVATGADLKTAVANAEDGDTIQFTADITFTAAQVGFKVDKDITFDLNGCTLAGPANGSVGAAVDPLKKTEVMFVTGTEENPTNVTFKDSVGGGSWTYSYSGSSQAFFCDIRDYANVTVLGGTYSADTCKYASAIFYVRSATATLTIEDGNFTSANGPKRDSLVYVNNGSAEINGGTFQSGKSSDYAVSSAQNKVVVINGGEFNGTISGSSNASTESGKSIVINGGTFNDYTGENVKDVTAYIADDVVQDASGTIVPVEATTVAKIGNNQYSTVAAAFAAAPTDGTKTTIKLIADSTSTSNIGVYGGTWSARVGGKNIVLDLNGHTYTQNKTNGTGAFVLAPSQDLTVGNSLTITDTSAGKDGKVTSNSQYTTIQVGTNCTFTLNAGTIENTGTDGTAIQISGTGSATLNNGTVTANDDCYAIYMYEASGNTTPYLKVKGGTISGYCAIATEAEATVDMTGGSIDADYAFIVDGESTVNVTGGTVDASYVGYNYTDTADINISGGTYTSEVPLAYCADGYESVYDAEAGVYVIEVDDHSVAKIGDVRYDSLEEAWNAAVDGDTITLLKNSAGNGLKAPQAKFNDAGLTVDFNGYTYTIDGDLVGSTGTQSQAFQLLMDNNITFQNGTIYSEKARMLVQNYSNLTLDNMVLTLNNTTTAPATVYTLSNNNGNVVIDDTVINANPVNNAYAFDVCRYSSY
ncbi:MAG: hypothetical protein IJI67_04725, partial [Clostridia bacterium]|nr:hypothetical protein [Clostridia bacterium]